MSRKNNKKAAMAKHAFHVQREIMREKELEKKRQKKQQAKMKRRRMDLEATTAATTTESTPTTNDATTTANNNNNNAANNTTDTATTTTTTNASVITEVSGDKEIEMTDITASTTAANNTSAIPIIKHLTKSKLSRDRNKKKKKAILKKEAKKSTGKLLKSLGVDDGDDVPPSKNARKKLLKLMAKGKKNAHVDKNKAVASAQFAMKE